MDALKQHSAGGLVYRNNDDAISIVMIQDQYGKWTFPKGHVEQGESLQDAARREISEEVGIDASLLRLEDELGTIDYTFESSFPRDIEASGLTPNGQTVTIHKLVTYYLFEYTGNPSLTSQEGEVEASLWVPISEIDTKNEYDDNTRIIAKAKELLNARN